MIGFLLTRLSGNILFWIFVKGVFTPHSAKIIRFAFVRTCGRRVLFIDLHSTNGILCHLTHLLYLWITPTDIVKRGRLALKIP